MMGGADLGFSVGDGSTFWPMVVFLRGVGLGVVVLGLGGRGGAGNVLSRDGTEGFMVLFKLDSLSDKSLL